MNAYTNGQITGGSALTTGYDFLTDGAQQVSASLARVATTATNATLLPPTVWSAANLARGVDSQRRPAAEARLDQRARRRLALPGGRPHASSRPTHLRQRSRSRAGSSSRWAATRASTSPTSSCRRLAARDWAQTFAGARRLGLPRQHRLRLRRQRHRRLLGGPERALRREPGRRDDGRRRFADAKAGFQGDLGLVGVYDEKAMAELTLYGLPMVSITGAHPASAAASAGFSVLAAAAEQVGAAVSSAAAARDDRHRSGGRARLRGVLGRRSGARPIRRGGSRPPARRLLPRPRRRAGHAPAPDRAEGDAEDRDRERARRPDHRPDVGRTCRRSTRSSPARRSTRRATEPEIGYDDVAFPAKLQTVTSVKGFAAAASRSSFSRRASSSARIPADGDQNGFQRLFTQIDGRVFVSSDTDYAPPTFDRIDALKTGGTITFSADISSGRPRQAGARPLPRRDPARGRPSSSSTARAASGRDRPDVGRLGAVLRSGCRLARERRRLDQQGLLLRRRGGRGPDRPVTIDLDGTQAPNGIYTTPSRSMRRLPTA